MDDCYFLSCINRRDNCNNLSLVNMIQSLHIKNFQSHKDSRLDFHPGVNVIVGASDSGKTSIIRALRWLIWNRPGGEDFRSDWGGDTGVEINTEDGFNTYRLKGKSTNEYFIAHKESFEKPKVLVAFGTKVPEEIQKALNIDDTNLQKQFDSPFLISSTPGEVAAYFNQIAHLEKIDSSISYVNGKITKLTSRQKLDEETLEEDQEKLKQYEYLDKFEIDLEDLEHRQASLIQLIASRKRLSEHLETMEENSRKIKKQEEIIKLQDPVNELLRLYEERKKLIKDQLEFKLTVIAIFNNKKKEDVLKKKIGMLPQVETLLKLYKEREALQTEQRTLQRSLKEIQTIKEKQLACNTMLEKKEALFHKHMPDTCPLCGRSDK